MTTPDLRRECVLTSIVELATGRGLADTHLVGPTGTGPTGFVHTGPGTSCLNRQVCATAVRSVAGPSPTKPRAGARRITESERMVLG
jgi:hypothetical protein